MADSFYDLTLLLLLILFLVLNCLENILIVKNRGAINSLSMKEKTNKLFLNDIFKIQIFLTLISHLEWTLRLFCFILKSYNNIRNI